MPLNYLNTRQLFASTTSDTTLLKPHATCRHFVLQHAQFYLSTIILYIPLFTWTHFAHDRG